MGLGLTEWVWGSQSGSRPGTKAVGPHLAAGAPSSGTHQVKQVPRRSPSERALGPMAKFPPCLRALSDMFAVPDLRETRGSTPTPSSRQTISTTGRLAHEAAFPEA